MIPEFAIREWSEHVPWTESEQVEQDLLICRALTEIYKDEYLASHLAFRGGTALHKLFLSPQPRYSEDIDLVQINAEPIKETYDHIRDALAFLGEPKVKQKKHNNTLIFRLESESIPVVPIHLKVEINCKEHFSVLPMQRMPFSVVNKWYKTIISKLDTKAFGLKETSRIKAFVFSFISVPAKWIMTARQYVLNIYTENRAYARPFKTGFG